MSGNTNNQNSSEKGSASKKHSFRSAVSSTFSTLWRWITRTVMGPSKSLVDMDVTTVENLESPTKMALKSFFRRKLAVVALVVLMSLFLFVFIGSLFIPMDINYNDPLQANISPN